MLLLGILTVLLLLLFDDDVKSGVGEQAIDGRNATRRVQIVIVITKLDSTNRNRLKTTGNTRDK